MFKNRGWVPFFIFMFEASKVYLKNMYPSNFLLHSLHRRYVVTKHMMRPEEDQESHSLSIQHPMEVNVMDLLFKNVVKISFIS